MVAKDDFNELPNAVRLWRLWEDPLSPGPVVYHDPYWGSEPGQESALHISFTNDNEAIAYWENHACGSNAHRANGPRVNEIVCFLLDGSRRVLVVAPVMTDLNASGSGGGGDDYYKRPKGNLDSTGSYFIWTSNMGESRQEAFIVRVPVHLFFQ